MSEQCLYTGQNVAGSIVIDPVSASPDAESLDLTKDDLVSNRHNGRGLRLLVCERRGLFREGLAGLLPETLFTDVQFFETMTEALSRFGPDGAFDVLLLGIRGGIPAEDPLAGVASARRAWPGVRVVVLADLADAPLLQHAAAAGVDAVLSTHITAEVLRGSLHLVLLGQKLFPAPVSSEAMSARAEQVARAETPPGQLPPLSEREDQILRFLASGTRNKLIAHDLGISEATVKFHIRALLRKLGAANRTQAAIWGMHYGIGEGSPAKPG